MRLVSSTLLEETNALQQHGVVWTTDDYLPIEVCVCWWRAVMKLPKTSIWKSEVH